LKRASISVPAARVQVIGGQVACRMRVTLEARTDLAEARDVLVDYMPSPLALCPRSTGLRPYVSSTAGAAARNTADDAESHQ
jgi:hypothetical protein